jgi:hypothetical protein
MNKKLNLLSHNALFCVDIIDMKIFKKFPQSVRQYLSNLSLVILGFMLNYVPGLLSKLPGFLGKVFTGLDRFVKMKVSMEIPVIVLFALAMILLHYLVMMFLKIKLVKKPSYLKFTNMDYKDWKIAWGYEYLPKYKRYNIRNIHPVCKKCDCALIEHYCTTGVDGIICPICETLYPVFMNSTAVEIIIEHEITKGRPPKAKPEPDTPKKKK